MREVFVKQVGKDSLISWARVRKQVVAGAKIFILLGVPLIVCLIVGANRNRSNGESEIERGLWRLSQRVSSLPVPNTQTAREPIHPVGPFDRGKFQTTAHPSDVADEPLTGLVSNDLTSMALELVHVIFRLPVKGGATSVSSLDLQEGVARAVFSCRRNRPT